MEENKAKSEEKDPKRVPDGYFIDYGLFGAPILRLDPAAEPKWARVTATILTLAFLIFLFYVWIRLLIGF